MLTRRKLLGMTAPAVGALITLPFVDATVMAMPADAEAAAAKVDDLELARVKEIVANAVRGQLTYCTPRLDPPQHWSKRDIDFCVALNLMLVDMNPDIYRLDRMMTGPCGFVFLDDADDKATVTASTRDFKTYYTLETAQDMRAMYGELSDKMLAKKLAKQISMEVRAERDRMKVKPFNGEICPYVPAYMVRGFDPTLFQPRIHFKTRYGVLDHNLIAKYRGKQWNSQRA